MADVYRTVKTEKINDNATTETEPKVTDEHGMNVAARVVSMIGGIIMAILGIRFILSLLGANRGNEFASFIYNVSHPFVAPFFGLFNYQEQIGKVRFEFETLVAMLFWAFVTWLVIQLITVGSRRNEV